MWVVDDESVGAEERSKVSPETLGASVVEGASVEDACTAKGLAEGLIEGVASDDVATEVGGCGDAVLWTAVDALATGDVVWTGATAGLSVELVHIAIGSAAYGVGPGVSTVDNAGISVATSTAVGSPVRLAVGSSVG